MITVRGAHNLTVQISQRGGVSLYYGSPLKWMRALTFGSNMKWSADIRSEREITT